MQPGGYPHEQPRRRQGHGRQAVRDRHPHHARDEDHRHARARRHGRDQRRAAVSASSTTCSARWPTTPCSTSTSRRPATSTSTSTTPSRTSALVLGAALAAGAGRPGRHQPLRRRRPCPWTSPWPRPWWTSVAGRTPSIDLPFRGKRAGKLPLAVDRARHRIARPHQRLHDQRARPRPQRPPPGRGRLQGARPGAARRLRDRPAPRGAGIDEGLARLMSRPAARRRARLRRRQPRQHRPGAGRRRGRSDAWPPIPPACRTWTRSSCRASARRPRRWLTCGEQDLVEPLREWVAAGKPLLGICLGYQLLFESSDEGDADDARACSRAGSTALRDAPTLPHTGWNAVRLDPAEPALRRDRGRLVLLLRPLVRAAPGRPGATSSRRPTTAGRSPARSSAGSVYGLQFHPEKSAAVGHPAALRNFLSRSPRGRRRAAGGRPDARPTRDPVPRRGPRPGRQGDAVRRTSPTRAIRPNWPSATRTRAPTRSSSSTSPPRPRVAARSLDVVRRTAGRAFVPLTVGGGVRSVEEMRDVLRAGRGQGLVQHRRRGPAGAADGCADGSAARRSSARSTHAACHGADRRAAALGGRHARRPQRHGPRRRRVGGAGRGARRGRAARHLDGPRRDRPRLRHGAPGRDRDARPRAGDRVGRRGGPGRLRDRGPRRRRDAVLAASIFHRRLFSIAEVKAAMAAAGLPVRPVEGGMPA